MSSSSSFLAVIAGSWGVLMSLSPLLQIRAMVRRRSSAGVSVGYLSVLAVGFTLWLAYGLSLGHAALIITNTVSLAVGVATIAVARHLRPGKQRSSPG
jgi:uncharacterized protein with PQ loop repeat